MYFLLLTSSLFPLSSFSFLMLFALLSFMWDIFCEFLVILGSQSHAGVIINMTGRYVCGGRVLTGGPHSQAVSLGDHEKSKILRGFLYGTRKFFSSEDLAVFHPGDIYLTVPFWEQGKGRSMAEGPAINMWTYT